MQRMTVEDLQKAMKLLSAPINEERLQTVTPALNAAIEMLQQLTKHELSKEIEPTTYLTELKKVGRGSRVADV